MFLLRGIFLVHAPLFWEWLPKGNNYEKAMPPSGKQGSLQNTYSLRHKKIAPCELFYKSNYLRNKQTLFRKTTIRNVTFSKQICIGLDFSIRKVSIGFDSSIRDLVDFRNRKMGSICSKILKKLETKSFHPGKFIEANSSQSCF